MRYFGGKARIANKICDILEQHRGKNQIFIDGTVGGANIVSKISGPRIAYDSIPELIHMYQALQDGWLPPTEITYDDYIAAKEGLVSDELRAFIGFGCSFGGKWFGGYARSADRNYAMNAYNSLMRKMKTLIGVTFKVMDLFDLECENNLIYFDPPYLNTVQPGVRGGFDHPLFWDKVRELSKTNTVIVSEYVAPSDFDILLEINARLDMQTSDNTRVERLWINR